MPFPFDRTFLSFLSRKCFSFLCRIIQLGCLCCNNKILFSLPFFCDICHNLISTRTSKNDTTESEFSNLLKELMSESCVPSLRWLCCLPCWLWWPWPCTRGLPKVTVQKLSWKSKNWTSSCQVSLATGRASEAFNSFSIETSQASSRQSQRRKTLPSPIARNPRSHSATIPSITSTQRSTASSERASELSPPKSLSKSIPRRTEKELTRCN